MSWVNHRISLYYQCGARLSVDFSEETLKARSQWIDTYTKLKKINKTKPSTKNSICGKTVLQKQGEIETFSDKQKSVKVNKHWFCSTKNSKCSPSSWNEGMLDSSSKAIQKYRVLW